MFKYLIVATAILTAGCPTVPPTNRDIGGADITTENSPPVANAGKNQKVTVGELVILNGTKSSDADEDQMIFFWHLVEVSPVKSKKPLAFVEWPQIEINDAFSSRPSFTTPDVDMATVLIFQLAISDGIGIDFDEVRIVVSPRN